MVQSYYDKVGTIKPIIKKVTPYPVRQINYDNIKSYEDSEVTTNFFNELH